MLTKLLTCAITLALLGSVRGMAETKSIPKTGEPLIVEAKKKTHQQGWDYPARAFPALPRWEPTHSP